MVADTGIQNPDSSRREVGRAGGGIWVLEKQGIPHRGGGISSQRPVCDSIVYFFWIHVVNILRIIAAANRSFHTGKLAGLFNNVADIAAVAYPLKFSIRHLCAVHDY